MEFSVHIETDFIVDAEDDLDAEQKAFDRFVDKGYRGAIFVSRIETENNLEDDEEIHK